MDAVINRFKSNTSAILYLAFGAIVLAHLLLFINYSFQAEVSVFTALGENLKTLLPLALLATMLPVVYRVLDRVVNTTVINILGLSLIALCVGYQIANVPGQAWSTVAFSGALILILYNYILKRHSISNTVALVFSFMVVWMSWELFEVVFQIGLWFYHPETLGYDVGNLVTVMRLMALWLLSPVVYVLYVVTNKDVAPMVALGNYRRFGIIMGICAIATGVWFVTGMLIPIPLDANGAQYLLEVNYFTNEHLQFSISRLSQITIMVAFPLLFIRGLRQ